MHLQQDSADPLANMDLEDESAATKEALEMLTRLSDMNQLTNYLSYGKWDLSERDVARLNKDEEMKQRVSINFSLSHFFKRTKLYN
jgi:hypothetical protein